MVNREIAPYVILDNFIIDLDNIWKWLGFNKKIKAKYLLDKNYEIEKDYKKSLSLVGSKEILKLIMISLRPKLQLQKKGGQNIQKSSLKTY